MLNPIVEIQIDRHDARFMEYEGHGDVSVIAAQWLPGRYERPHFG